MMQEIINLDQLIEKLELNELSYEENITLHTSFYTSVSDVYNDVRNILINNLKKINKDAISLKRAYVYYIASIILNELEIYPEFALEDPEFIKLLEMIVNNEIFICEANMNSEEINRILTLS